MGSIDRILSDLFGRGVTGDIRFARVGTNIVEQTADALQGEAQLGQLVASDLQAKLYRMRPGIVTAESMMSMKGAPSLVSDDPFTSVIDAKLRTMQGSGQRAFAHSQFLGGLSSTISRNQAAATFVWDPEFYRRATIQAGAKTGGGLAPLIGLRQMAAEVFPDFAGGTTIGAVHEGLGLGRVSGSGGPEHLENILRAAHGANPAAVQSFIERSMTGGIDRTDPFNIQRHIGSKIFNNRNYLTKTGSAHIAGDAGMEWFTQAIQKQFGRTYAQDFGRFANEILKEASSPNDVAFLMTNERRIFIGKAGVANSYRELPAQRGGVLYYGGSRSGVRDLINYGEKGKVKGIKTVSRAFLDEFLAGMKGHGAGLAVLSAAIEKGSKNATQAKLLAHGQAGGMTFGQLKNPITSLGDLSFHGAYFMGSSVVAGDTGMVNLSGRGGAIGGGIINAMNFGSTAGLSDKLGRATRQDIADMQRINEALGGKLNVAEYGMLAPGKSEGASMILPKTGISAFFAPGTHTERSMTKGRYQFAGIREVWRPGRISRVEASRRRIDIERGRPVGTSPGIFGEEIALKRLWQGEVGQRYMMNQTPMVEMAGAIGVMVPGNLRQRELFGDSGALMTGSGLDLFKQRRPLIGTTATLSSMGLESSLKELAGQGGWNQGWQALLDETRTGQSKLVPQGIPIFGTPSALNVPKDAKYLTGITYNDWDQAYQFKWSTGSNNVLAQSMLVNNQRVSARVAPASLLKKEFGQKFVASVDMIMGAADWAKAGRGDILYRHMTGLLGTKFGHAQGGVGRFMQMYQGGGLQKVAGGTRLMWNKNFDIEKFITGSENALSRMGFTPAQIYGYAGPASQTPGIDALRKLEMKKGALYRFMGGLSDRFRDVDDILNQDKSFRMRLYAMHQMGQSMATTHGLSSPMQHPIYRRLAEHYMASVPGVSIDPTDLTPFGFLKSLPEEMERIVQAMEMPGSVGSKYEGTTVLSRQAAATKYSHKRMGGLTSRMLQGGMSKAEIFGTDFLKPGRKGFFLHMGNSGEWNAPLQSKLPGEVVQTLGVHGAWIPGSDELRRMIGEGQYSKGTYLHSILTLMEQPTAGPSAGAMYGTRLTAKAAFADIYRHQAGMTSKQGFFSKTMLASTKLPGSARGRLIQKISAKGGTSYSMMNATEDIFTVHVQRETIEEMATQLAKEKMRTTGADPSMYKIIKEDISNELFRKVEKGSLFGGITPRPQHASSHFPMVKLALEDAASTNLVKYAGEPTVAVNPFVAWSLNRDFDKDSIEIMAILDEHMTKIGGEGKAKAIMQSQLRHAQPSYAAYAKATAAAETAIENVSERIFKATGKEQLDLLTDMPLRFFGFGKLPPLSQVGSWTTMAFAQTVADTSRSASDVATLLNRRTSTAMQFDEGAINRFRSMLGGDATGIVQRAIELQRNPYQGVITKGEGGLKSLIDEYLNIPHEIMDMADSLKDEELIEQSIAKVRKYLVEQIGPEGAGKLEGIFANIHTGTADFYLKNGKTAEGIIDLMASDLGRMTGAAAIAVRQHYQGGEQIGKRFMAPGHPIRDLTGRISGSLTALWAMVMKKPEQEIRKRTDMIAEEIIEGSQEELARKEAQATADAGRAAANKEFRRRSGSEILETMSKKFKGNWMVVAGIAGGLIALRELSGIAQDAAGFAGGSSPLPKQPMLTSPEAARPDVFPQHTANIMPVEGYNSAFGYNGSIDSESIGGIMDSFDNLFDRGSSHTTVDVRDSRRFRSNFDMARLSNQKSRSDFVHPYQYND